MHNQCMNRDGSLRTESLLAAQRAKALGLTQEQIASAIGASQSQVSRILAGASLRRSKLFSDVCEYVYSHAKPGRQSKVIAQDLQDAVAQVWDGTPKHAHALALVIRSLGALSMPTAALQTDPVRRRSAK